jgi:hypothetical protein
MTDNYALEIRGADRRVINESPSFPRSLTQKRQKFDVVNVAV